jgi:hypothetical protein
MSDFVLNTPVLHSHGGLHSFFRRLFSRKAEPALPSELQSLPEHLLEDIGIDSRGALRPAEAAAERLGLLDLGWQQPRRPR